MESFVLLSSRASNTAQCSVIIWRPLQWENHYEVLAIWLESLTKELDRYNGTRHIRAH